MSDLLVHYPSWTVNAACSGVDPDIFHPKSMEGPEAERALALCKRCPVARDCFGWAVENNDQWGIRGGYTPRQRTAILDQVSGKEKPAPKRGNINRTHCKNRHEFTEENSRWTSAGVLVCRTCAREAAARQTERRRAAREAKAVSA